MKLPNIDKAVVTRAKVCEYLLSDTPPTGLYKAAFFRRFGFALDSWEALAIALIEHALDHEIAATEESPFGMRYPIEGALATPDGRAAVIRSVWFVEQDGEVPRFVTAYPLRRRAQ